MGAMMTNWFGAAVVVFALLVSQSAMAQSKGKPGGEGAKPIAVRTHTVSAAPVRQEITVVGSLRAEETVTVKPEIDGRIVQIHVREGQPVKKGARLVTLDAAEYEAQLAANAADIKIAQVSFDRAKELAARQMVSRQELDQLEARLDQAKAQERLIRVQLAKTVITAPFAGVVGLRQVSPGAYVEQGQELFNLEQTNPLQLEFKLPEVHVGTVKPGTSVSLEVDAFPGRRHGAKVFALDAALDPLTRSIPVRARLDNRGGLLRPGMFARVTLSPGAQAQAQGLWVPEQAIWPKGQQSFVYRVVNGKAQLTQVRLGLRKSGRVQVVEGVKAGDVIVTDGQMKLQMAPPNAAVVLQNAPSATGS